MIQKFRLSAALLLTLAATATASAQTNLLQAVSIDFNVYTQRDAVIHGNPPQTNNYARKSFLHNPALIKAVSADGKFKTGDLLVRSTPVTNDSEAAPSWDIYNTLSKSLVPISTNVYFNVHTTHVYGDTNEPAYVHGEIVKDNGELENGQTYEIRTLVLSNSAMMIRLQGYAHGHIVRVSLTPKRSTNDVYSQNYRWEGTGSGVISNVPVVIDGFITEDYRKLMK